MTIGENYMNIRGLDSLAFFSILMLISVLFDPQRQDS
jgi:hypothetical protein